MPPVKIQAHDVQRCNTFKLFLKSLKQSKHQPDPWWVAGRGMTEQKCFYRLVASAHVKDRVIGSSVGLVEPPNLKNERHAMHAEAMTF